MDWNVDEVKAVSSVRATGERIVSGIPVVLLVAALVIHGLPLISSAAEMSPPVTVEAGPIGGQRGRAEEPPRMIEEIRVERSVADKAGFFFRLNGFTVPECARMEREGRKLVCDFIETRLAPGVRLDLEPIMRPPVRMRIGVHYEPVEKTRVVFDLDQSTDYDVEQFFVEKDNEFVLVIHGVSP